MTQEEFLSKIINMSKNKTVLVNNYGLLEHIKDVTEESDCIVIELPNRD